MGSAIGDQTEGGRRGISCRCAGVGPEIGAGRSGCACGHRGGRTGGRKKVPTGFLLHFILFRSRDMDDACIRTVEGY
jgi:hypothetical protein